MKLMQRLLASRRQLQQADRGRFIPAIERMPERIPALRVERQCRIRCVRAGQLDLNLPAVPAPDGQSQYFTGTGYQFIVLQWTCSNARGAVGRKAYRIRPGPGIGGWPHDPRGRPARQRAQQGRPPLLQLGSFLMSTHGRRKRRAW